MSDLDATSSRVHSAAPITAIASGKLRSLSGNGLVFSQADGLADAFAEVFARIAASSVQTIETPEPIAESESIQIDADEQSVTSHENAPKETQSANIAVENIDIDLEPLVIDVEPQLAATVEADPIEEVVVDTTSVTRDVQADDHPVEEIVEIAPVEVAESDVVQEEVEATKVIVQKVQPDEPQDHTRQRRERAIVEPAENTDDGQRHRDRTSLEELNRGNSDKTTESDDHSLEPPEQFDHDESPRRLGGRGRRDRQTSHQHQPQPVSPSGRAQAAQAIATSALSGEAVASQLGLSPDVAARGVASNVDPGIANIQSFAAKIQQSGNASAAPSAGTRGSTQAVSSTPRARIVPDAKPNPAGGKSNAQTVSRIKLIQRVSKAFQHLGPEGGVVRLRLAPAEMGSVRVEMRINQRIVQARVVAETEAASQALREHLPDLRARLESYGMQVEKLDIETEGKDLHPGSQFGAQSHQHDRQRQNEHGPGRRMSQSNEPVSQQVPQSTMSYQVETVASGVDVRL